MANGNKSYKVDRLSDNNHKPVLVITRALPGMCGGCDHYSRYVDTDFKDLLKKDSRVNVLELTKEPDKIYLTKDPSVKIHPEIYSWVTWWPSFIIFTANSWNDHGSNLQGAVFGGKINRETGTIDEITPDDEDKGKGDIYDYRSVEKLIKWVEDTLNSKLFVQMNRGLRKYQEYKEACDPRYGWCMGGKKSGATSDI
jgi:hypothetical protein